MLNVLNKQQGTHVIMESKNTENIWESITILILQSKIFRLYISEYLQFY